MWSVPKGMASLWARTRQRVAEVSGMGSQRTEYPADFVAEDEAVRVARDLSETLMAAIRKYADSFTFLDTSMEDGNFAGRESFAGNVGRAAGGLARVLHEKSEYRGDLAILAEVGRHQAELESRLCRELNIGVIAPLKYWLKGTGNDVVRARRALGERRLELDASGGEEDKRRAFEEQLATVRALIARVPDELEEHRLLVRKFLALLAAHSAALHKLYSTALGSPPPPLPPPIAPALGSQDPPSFKLPSNLSKSGRE